MGLLSRNMFKKWKIFVLAAVLIITITTILRNQNKGIGKFFIGKLYLKTQINYDEGVEQKSIGEDNFGGDGEIMKESVHVFRLGSNLLESGAVDGPDSKRKMKNEKDEVPIVFVDEHHEGMEHSPKSTPRFL